jgi:hypothetical protein
MHDINYVIYSLWAVFWLAWLVAALSAKRTAQSGMRQFVGVRVAIFVIVLLAQRLRAQFPLAACLSPPARDRPTRLLRAPSGRG